MNLRDWVNEMKTSLSVLTEVQKDIKEKDRIKQLGKRLNGVEQEIVHLNRRLKMEIESCFKTIEAMVKTIEENNDYFLSRIIELERRNQ